MKKAIKIAIENGWIPKEHTVFRFDFLSNKNDIYEGNFLNDYLFWQSLGKGLGLNPTSGQNITSIGTLDIYEAGWIEVWHQFIDHLAEGKDINSFFNNLI